MFVVNGHALEPIDFLHFVDQMLLQFLRAANVEDFVRVNRSFSELLAFLDIIALEHDDVFADRNKVFLFDGGLLIFVDDDSFAAHAGSEIDGPVDLGNLGGVLRPAGFEQLGDAWQTTGDVLGLGGFSRRLSHQCTGDDLVAFGDDDVRGGRNRIIGGGFAVVIEDDDLRVQIFFVFDDNHGLLAGGFVHFLFHGDTLDDVVELHLARLLRENGDVVRVPLDE